MTLAKDEFFMNRRANCGNEYQGHFMRVLCVCSAGLLRSPTAAVVLAGEPWNYNTRAVGLTPEFALIPVDLVLLEWADIIVCMSSEQVDKLKPMLSTDTEIISLDIPDQYAYRDPELIRLINERFTEKFKDATGV